jgi:tellurium resistance protein TerZ
MAISLAKGQKISLEKSSDAGLSRVIMGLGWDAKKVKTGGFLGMFAKETTQSIDLDASCVMFDAAGGQTDTVWFRQLASKCGSVSHTGDNRTGDGDGDDEQIIVELGRVPANVKHLVFVVNSFTGQSFDQIDNATCRLVDARGDKELLRYELSGSGSHNAQVMLRLYREGGGWQVHAIGEKASGRTFEALLPAIRPHLN